MPEKTHEIRCWNTEAVGLHIEKRAIGDATTNTIVGHAAVFNSLSEDLGGFREKIKRGAFRRSINEGANVVANIEHASGLSVLGRTPDTLRLREDRSGLLAEIDLPDTTAGRDVAVLVDSGRLAGMSFKFRTVADEWHVENGEQVRTVNDVDLFDVTITASPAYPDTDVAMRSLAETLKAVERQQAEIAEAARVRRAKLREVDLTAAEERCSL